MMTRYGEEVTVYWGTENEAECTEFVSCHGPLEHSRPVVPEFTPESFAPMNLRVIEELAKRIEPHDLILLTSGWSQQHIMRAFPDHICVEPMTGYFGTAAPYRVFPSHAWMHMVYGRWSQDNPQAIRGGFYDAVIPHFLDPDDFPEGDGSGDYLLFAARLNEDKGIGVAVDIAKRTGLELKIIGAGTPPDFGEYLGVVGPKERRRADGQRPSRAQPVAVLRALLPGRHRSPDVRDARPSPPTSGPSPRPSTRGPRASAATPWASSARPCGSRPNSTDGTCDNGPWTCSPPTPWLRNTRPTSTGSLLCSERGSTHE